MTSTTSQTVVQPGSPGATIGAQEPRCLWLPPCVGSAGQEAIELADMAGLFLDPWQKLVLAHSLAERDDGKWAAFEVGLVVSRQNGKGSILEARELAGLFLLGERLIIHSAHQFDTSLEAFRRLLALVEETPEFSRRVRRVSRSHGEEGIELKGGQRIRFRTRTKGGGRGFTSDCLILDEAMDLPEVAHGALLPTLSARPNPQVWYTGSAVDRNVHEHGIVFARVRERGLKGGDRGLAFFEWSVDVDEFAADPELASSPGAWAQANPGLGIRIAADHVALEQRSMDPHTFSVERLGVGDWPSTDGLRRVISSEAWAALIDASSAPGDPLTFAIDVSPDRSFASIAVAGRRGADEHHVEVVDRRPGTGWVVDRAVELERKHGGRAWIVDAAGPVSSLLFDLAERLDVEPAVVSAQQHAQAFGLFVDAVEQGTLRHLGSVELASALAGAVKRPLGDAWAWSRKSSTVDISPLVACTLALWGSVTAMKASAYESKGLLVLG